MKSIDVYGIGNGIMDILLSVTEQEFAGLGLKKGAIGLVDMAAQKALLTKLGERNTTLASGGSAANTIIAVAQLGGKAAYSCCVADDQYGLYYRSELTGLGIKYDTALVSGGMTGTCILCITPDAERSGNTCLGVSATFSPQHVEEDKIRAAEWLYVEGYLFAQPEHAQPAIWRALELAKKHGTKVAITFSDAFVVEIFGEALRRAVGQADLIFANTVEACKFTGCSDAQSAFEHLSGVVPNAVVTRSAEGALIRFNGVECAVPAFPCQPADLTGAGDMYAGAFLYGITHGASAAQAGLGAGYLAMKVVTQVGARLRTDVKEYWREATKSGGPQVLSNLS